MMMISKTASKLLILSTAVFTAVESFNVMIQSQGLALTNCHSSCGRRRMTARSTSRTRTRTTSSFSSRPSSLPRSTITNISTSTTSRENVSHLSMVNSDVEIDVDFEDDEEAEVGTMRVTELKSELTLRGVDFSDCFDKESLAKKLRDARASGKADPTIIDQFNKQRDDMNENKIDIDDDLLEKVTGGDGTLPGGMPPDMLQKLMSNPELMTLMQNPKMQDVMKLMMTGGAESLQKTMEEDQEVYEIVTKLNAVMGDAL